MIGNFAYQICLKSAVLIWNSRFQCDIFKGPFLFNEWKGSFYTTEIDDSINKNKNKIKNKKNK